MWRWAGPASCKCVTARSASRKAACGLRGIPVRGTWLVIRTLPCMEAWRRCWRDDGAACPPCLDSAR
ncbi:hypothetical protein BDU57DRAFT_520611 [Ampelomyces quisqualis]|uniref:Uncharacterized protein n=1 Tax=Ampelomyces quisqualis TaxID=50730 RepID=A0A6A5QHV9_AMPQU|nr:hypothetical protein BDU57DRAFT_520611 [Ampelomyces quisqualis]